METGAKTFPDIVVTTNAIAKESYPESGLKRRVLGRGLQRRRRDSARAQRADYYWPTGNAYLLHGDRARPGRKQTHDSSAQAIFALEIDDGSVAKVTVK